MKTLKVQKWVGQAKPEHFAVDVARQVVGQRMESVWHYLKLAATRPDEDIEYVHQLRVATRRTAAACQVFTSLARKKRLRRLLKELRQLRRAAGMARDLDVLCERLKEAAHGDSQADLTAAIARVRKRRQQAQKPLVRASRRWERGKRKRQVRRLVRRGLWRPSQSKRRFGDVSHGVLACVVDDFFDAASADLSDMEPLHELRIRGKRLRYTIELVAGAFDKTLRQDIYPDFEDVQERIGVVNDHATAQEIFAQWCEKAAGQEFANRFRRLAQIEQERTEATRGEFQQWWSPQRSERLRLRFQLLLLKDCGPAAKNVRSGASADGTTPRARSAFG